MALPDETALRLLAARKIEAGALPRAVPQTAFGGKGDGLSCSLCEQPIAASDYEFEYAVSSGEIRRFHLRCHDIWQVVLANWRRAAC
jgi:hypothetical protein